MRKFFKFTLKWIIIVVVTYLFLSLFNYSLNLENWNGFSRFILGLEGIIFLLNIVDNF